MGLIQDAQAQQPVAPQQQQPQQGKTNLPPEQQQQLELIAKQASDYIMEDANTDMLVKSAANDPVMAIASIGETVLQAIYQAAAQAGHEMAPELLGLAATQIALLFSAVLVNEGVIDIKQLQEVAQQAYEAGLNKHNGSVQQPAQQMEQPQAQPGQPPMQGGM